MSRNAGIITFKDVSYEHQEGKPILVETSFSIRRGAKFTLMGKNGAGKSTLFGLITGQYSTVYGNVFIMPKISIAVSKQVIPKEELELTIRDFFQNLFEEKVYNIDSRIDEVLEIINLGTEKGTEVYETFKDRTVGSFSGGQQARLLLASALILKPEVLLLDEPTNNLDVEGIAYLTKFLKEYKKTVIVISHDAEFLNSFTQGVLYLNSQTRKIEKYDGNYNNVVGEIERQVAKETRKNA
ncbi:MAG: ATP-binding cassette domain-containing protein [Candidatus Pacebacteria bacterium]|nr:ATP-binding cassette domain-containing protein [Candidatus Paceibacterota bacterium]